MDSATHDRAALPAGDRPVPRPVARAAAPLPRHGRWPDRCTDRWNPGTQPLVFVTVGTDHHPFDRLMDWIDRWGARRRERPPRRAARHGRAAAAAAGRAVPRPRRVRRAARDRRRRGLLRRARRDHGSPRRRPPPHRRAPRGPTSASTSTTTSARSRDFMGGRDLVTLADDEPALVAALDAVLEGSPRVRIDRRRRRRHRHRAHRRAHRRPRERRGVTARRRTGTEPVRPRRDPAGAASADRRGVADHPAHALDADRLLPRLRRTRVDRARVRVRGAADPAPLVVHARLRLAARSPSCSGFRSPRSSSRT